MRLHQTDEHNYVEFQPAAWLVNAKAAVVTGMIGLFAAVADVAIANRIIDAAKSHDLATNGVLFVAAVGLLGAIEIGIGVAFVKAAYSDTK